jgi:hypothetical protein
MPLGFRSGSPGATNPSTVDDALLLAIASTSNAGRSWPAGVVGSRIRCIPSRPQTGVLNEVAR